ncbi:MAG: hypothetical protein J1F10_00385 [Muribaculaceae bacterium]|nr:hypothetical protein [Muribaculaceae bacterium]
MKKSKLLILGGIALAFSACSDDAHINAPDGTADDGLKTATITVGQWGQTRATNLDTWSYDHNCACNWSDDIFNYELPGDAEDITKPGFNQNASVFFVPEGDHGTLNFGWQANINNAKVLYLKGSATFNDINFPSGLKVYIAGNYAPQTLGNNWSNIDFIVLKDAELTINSVSLNSSKLYNAGTVNMPNGFDGSKIAEVYNAGELNIGKEGSWLTIPGGVKLNSNGGYISITGQQVQIEATCDIHNMVGVKGKVVISNSNTKYICGLEIDGNLQIDNVGLISSYIKAKEITFNGHPIKLLPEAYVVAEKISMPTSKEKDVFIGYTGSHALIETKDFYFRNKSNFQDNFSHNIYFNVTGTIDIEEIIVRDNGQQDNAFNKYNSIDEYLNSQNGEKLDREMFNADIAGAPECGESYGTKEPEPETKLVKVGIIEAPNHNHDSDKSEDKRHLSATCIDFDGTTFYASYHMRGYNWGNDQYDNDETEGCIETWTIEEVETEGVKENKLVLGHYMWTHDFDFNHLILDGGDIITVGHKDGIGTSGENKNLGAIIGRIPKTFTDVIDPKEGDDNVYAYDPDNEISFSYKYLTTDEKLYKEWENPKKGNTTVQFVDYKNAGDGNCVIKVGNKYYVTTFAGYGIIDRDFNRVKDEAGNILFVQTPYSAKHIIPAGDSYKVLFLNDEPEGKNVAETDKSTVSIATFTGESDILGSADDAVQLTDCYVQPVDGKNVLAYYGNKLYACLGKGGLNINNEKTIKFGEEGEEPVNGVALDEKYIYVACGSQLRVLDINTQVEVAKYCIPNKSANYIKLGVINGQKYIAVAFGQEGVQVFRLEEAK